MSNGQRLADLRNLDIALAHWHIRSWGGAEYLVTKLAEALEVNAVYTLGEPGPDAPNPYGDARFIDVRSDLAVPRLRRFVHRAGRVAEYSFWEDVDWRHYGDPDLLLTSGATTRAVITPDDMLHVNYCHSPPRWFYDLYHDRKDSRAGLLARPALRLLRIWDHAVDSRVDWYLANSPIIARRLWKYYKRDSEVLYPPVDMDQYQDRGDEGFYLHLGRLDREKGISEVVDAFADADRRLILVGARGDASSSLLRRIERTDSIEWVGFVPEQEKLDWLSRARAVVFNGRNEDFGIVPVEANASGKPCLARDEGFASLLIEEGENGLLHDGSAADIRDAINRFENHGLDGDPRETARQFSIESFETRLEDRLVDYVNAFEELTSTDF